MYWFPFSVQPWIWTYWNTPDLRSDMQFCWNLSTCKWDRNSIDLDMLILKCPWVHFKIPCDGLDLELLDILVFEICATINLNMVKCPIFVLKMLILPQFWCIEMEFKQYWSNHAYIQMYLDMFCNPRSSTKEKANFGVPTKATINFLHNHINPFIQHKSLKSSV